MRKRIMAFVLALAMILTLIPQTAFAANFDGGELKYRVCYEDDGRYIESDEPLRDVLEMENEDRTFLYFYYCENNIERRVPSNQLKVANEEMAGLYSHYDDEYIVSLEMFLPGETTIDYEVSGNVYSVKIISSLPNFGFYSSKEASYETYLPYVTVSEKNNKFYFIARNGWKLTNINLYEEFRDIIKVTIDETGEYATFEVLKPIRDMYCFFTYDASNDEKNDLLSDCWYQVYLCSKFPSLKFRVGEMTSEGLIEYDEEFGEAIEVAVEYEYYLFLYYIEEDTATRVSYDEITVADENIIKLIPCEENENAVKVKLINEGETTIEYKKNGEIQDIEIYAVFPTTAFYTTPKMSGESYITDFSVTKEKNTFYLVNSGGACFENVSLDENFDAIADAVIDKNNNQLIKITVYGTPKNGEVYTLYVDEYNLEVDYRDTFWYEIVLYDGEKDVDYTLSYDIKEGQLKGIEVGDEVYLDTLFDTNNLYDDQTIRFSYLAYEGGDVVDWTYLDIGKKSMLEIETDVFDEEEGWYVSEIRYDKEEKYIYVDLVSRVPIKGIESVYITCDWDGFKDFQLGKFVPYVDDSINITGEGIQGLYESRFMVKVKPEHIQKGYITESQYDYAIKEMDGWLYMQPLCLHLLFTKNVNIEVAYTSRGL